MPKCEPCERIQQIKEGKNPYFVAEFETGYVVLGDHQYFKGYTLFLCKEHVFELHELNPVFKQKFLAEMAQVAEAVYFAFKPKKLNYELLGNGDPHLHWHIFPRHADDIRSWGVTWNIDASIRNAEETKPSPEELQSMKEQLRKHLKSSANNVT